jgi:hypothetical protein
MYRPQLSEGQESHLRRTAEQLPAGLRGRFLTVVRSRLRSSNDGELFALIKRTRWAVISGAKIAAKHGV